MIVYGTTSLGGMVVFAAGLSFLGVGVQPPTGGLGHHGVGRARRAGLGAWVSLIPGGVIVIVAVSLNFMGDGPCATRSTRGCGRGAEAMSGDPILSVSGLVTHFFVPGGVVKAVDGVDLEIGGEEIVAIVGESGSGKSVTALSIMRLIAEPRPHPGRQRAPWRPGPS